MSSHLSGACTGSSEVACRRMQISTLDISGITTTVRRHEALLRFARYLFVYNLVILLWVIITKLSQMPSFEGLLESIAGLDWKFATLVIGSVGASYLILAHRLWWAFAVIMVAQVGYFFYGSSAELAGHSRFNPIRNWRDHSASYAPARAARDQYCDHGNLLLLHHDRFVSLQHGLGRKRWTGPARRLRSAPSP